MLYITMASFGREADAHIALPADVTRLYEDMCT